MEERRTAGKGLYYLFFGEIIVLLSILPLVGGLILIAAALLSLYGYYTLSKARQEYRQAFLIGIVVFLIQIVADFSDAQGFLSVALGLIAAFLNAMVIYLVCNTTSTLLLGLDNATADLGQKIWKGVILCTGIDMVCMVLAVIPLINILALVAVLIADIAQVVISILYLVFLWKSQKALRS